MKLTFFTLFVLLSIAYASTLEKISFPVTELGNCNNVEECKAYCNEPSHVSACIEFAQKNSLQYSEASIVFPISELDGCSSFSECQKYCEDANNIEACLNYAERRNLLSSEKIAEARKVMPFLKAGTTPGKCKSEVECLAYCDIDAHFSECIGFAEKAGFVSSEDAAIARRVGGKGPGNCKRKEQCMQYCETEEHFSECISFAEQHGLIDSREAAIARKVGPKGGPGGCKSEQQCMSFCSQPDQMQQCMEFALKYDLIPADQVKIVKKFAELGFKGPGGCRNQNECMSYCFNPTHLTECMQFARQMGFAMQPSGIPQACIERELDELQCRELCMSNPTQCGFSMPMYQRS